MWSGRVGRAFRGISVEGQAFDVTGDLAQLPLGGFVIGPLDEAEPALPTPTRSVDQRRGQQRTHLVLGPGIDDSHHDVR
jgi:hypothetical protein